MALKKDLDDLDANGVKGDWCFSKDDEYLVLRWGDTPDNICMVNIGDQTRSQGMWAWNGNRDAPTLSPSVRVFSGETTLWHGYLRDGKMEAC